MSGFAGAWSYYKQHSAALDRAAGVVTLTTSGRYVRMTGTRRTTGFGCSLWEFGIHN